MDSLEASKMLSIVKGIRRAAFSSVAVDIYVSVGFLKDYKAFKTYPKILQLQILLRKHRVGSGVKEDVCDEIALMRTVALTAFNLLNDCFCLA